MTITKAGCMTSSRRSVRKDLCCDAAFSALIPMNANVLEIAMPVEVVPMNDDDRPLRILIGTMENGENLSNLADGFVRLGHSVTKVFQANESQHNRTISADILLSDVLSGVTYSIVNGNKDEVFWNVTQTIRDIIENHDIFIFQSGKSLLPGNDDFQIIKASGKKIISLFTGTEVRHWSAAEPQYNSWGRCYWPCHTEKWDVSGATKSEMIFDRFFYNNWSVSNKLYTLRMAELYSDAIISTPEQMGLAIRPYFQGYVPVDISRFTPSVPNREVPVIVHAPSHRIRKGSDFITYAVNLMRFRGIACEFRLFENIDHSTVVKELCQADIAIDQLYAMCHGAFAVEAMAAGCATLASNVPEFLPGQEDKPLQDIHPGNLPDQLHRIIVDRPFRCQLAEDGRRYVERYHTPEAVAVHFLRTLRRAEQDDFDYWPSLFLLHYRLPRNTTLPDFIRRLNWRVISSGRVPPGTDPKLLQQRGLIHDAPQVPFGRNQFLPRTDLPVGSYGYHPNPIDFDC